jgi:hypothetical protein
MPMNSNQLYGFRSYLKSSLWVVSFIAIPVEFAVTWILSGVGAGLGWSATAHPHFSGKLGAPTAGKCYCASLLQHMLLCSGPNRPARSWGYLHMDWIRLATE